MHKRGRKKGFKSEVSQNDSRLMKLSPAEFATSQLILKHAFDAIDSKLIG
jgi:hypothetical protein